MCLHSHVVPANSLRGKPRWTAARQCPEVAAVNKQQFQISNFFYFALRMAQRGWIEREKCS